MVLFVLNQCYVVMQVGGENASLKPITDLLPKVKKAVKTFSLS